MQLLRVHLNSHYSDPLGFERYQPVRRLQCGAEIGRSFGHGNAGEADRLVGGTQRSGARVLHLQRPQRDAGRCHAVGRMHVAPLDQRRQRTVKKPLTISAHGDFPGQQALRRHARGLQQLAAIQPQVGQRAPPGLCLRRARHPVDELRPGLAQAPLQFRVIQVKPAVFARRTGAGRF